MTNLIFIDFETFFSKDYSLKKMTPIEYVLDKRFQCLGMAVQERDKQPYWVDGSNIVGWIRDIGRSKSSAAFVSHNALFDMLILAWRYNFTPKIMLDTLGMSRAMLGHKLKSHSLASISEYFKFSAKGTTLNKMIGVNRAHLLSNHTLYSELQSYACDDVGKCCNIFYKLIKEFPKEELQVMDMVLRACILPQFKLDRDVLTSHLFNVLLDKENLLKQTSVLAEDLRSNEKFARLLRELGVDPPMKTSPSTGKETYAFSKIDSEFIDLQEHEDVRVQALIAARLGHKTSLEETRTRRLIAISNLVWPVGHRWMPIPLRYSGAHTHRLSGDMKLNMQNLPRRSALRKALVAPIGSSVLSIDLSQIEARIVAWICHQKDLVEDFAAGDDIYSEFASEVFGIEVSRKVNPDWRFVGKTAILGLGYKMSWKKYILTVKAQSKNQLGKTLELSIDEGQKVVNAYRNKYQKIVSGWNKLGSTGISTLINGGDFMFGPCLFQKQQITLPNQMKLYYNDLAYRDESLTFTYGGLTKYLFDGKVLENITQALARIVIMDLALRVEKAVGRFAHQVHDELIYVVRNNHVEEVKEYLLTQAKVRPSWAPDLPLAAEVKIGQNYGEMD